MEKYKFDWIFIILLLLILIDQVFYVTLSPLLLQRGLRIGPIQRNGAAPSDSHWAFFCPNSVEVVGKINGGE
jgi:hypothetical protein